MTGYKPTLIKPCITYGRTLKPPYIAEFQVSVYVRTPSKVPENMKDKVNIIQGDVFNDEEVNKAMEGQDAVVFAIGQHRVLGKIIFQFGIQ